MTVAHPLGSTTGGRRSIHLTGGGLIGVRRVQRLNMIGYGSAHETHESGCVKRLIEQALDLRQEFIVCATGIRKKCRAFASRATHGRAVQSLYVFPAFWCHGRGGGIFDLQPRYRNTRKTSTFSLTAPGHIDTWLGIWLTSESAFVTGAVG